MIDYGLAGLGATLATWWQVVPQPILFCNAPYLGYPGRLVGLPVNPLNDYYVWAPIGLPGEHFPYGLTPIEPNVPL